MLPVCSGVNEAVLAGFSLLPGACSGLPLALSLLHCSCLPCLAQAADREFIFPVSFRLVISHPFQSWVFFLLPCSAFLQYVCVLAWHRVGVGESLFFLLVSLIAYEESREKIEGLCAGTVMVNLTFPKYSELSPQ